MAETKQEQKSTPAKRATAGFILSLIGGIIDAIVAIILIATSILIEDLGEMIPGYQFGRETLAAIVEALGVIGLFLAIIVIIGAVLIYTPGREVVGGILVIIFSLIGIIFTAGGLFVGLILGIIGGALGIAKK